ncbi:hypothetical protein L249_7368 [Ophiocordyceps polyrhachis-furcata BCC 54312]|uniref:Uncharacterized protein n=1 Tax=Ophiocordyceps polyrhachis-furcata BCC 54312 TaxID=1330021 RepID=A0A367L9W2_9HYPO|nr:hypothetical protein L249_7368 [Ophiocordyceps polyrhachis-furcata BCC 54312]
MQFGGETPSALPIWEAHLLKGGRPPVYLYYLHSISKRYRSGAKTRLWYLQACFVYYDVVVLFWLHTLDTYKRYIPINVKLVCRLPSRPIKPHSPLTLRKTPRERHNNVGGGYAVQRLRPYGPYGPYEGRNVGTRQARRAFFSNTISLRVSILPSLGTGTYGYGF